MTEPTKMNFYMPPEFYRKVLADYNDWRFAWVREVLQNLIDAGATIANITTKIVDNEHILVTVIDNGHGMNTEVLKTGFMSMGGSVKDGGDNDVGGFGVASMMIAQSHFSYIIKSQDFICEGATGTYEVRKSDDFINGCEISVVMRNEDLSRWGAESILKSNIEKWSEFANIPQLKILFNGEDMSPKCQKFDYELDSELGAVHFSEASADENSSILYVRMKNQPMFSINTYCPDQANFTGVLDLNGSSKDNLTSNRDGLAGNKRDKISTIIKELSNERSKYKLSNMDGFILNEVDEVNFEEVSTHLANFPNDVASSVNNNGSTTRNSVDDSEGKSRFTQIFNKEKEAFATLKESIEKKIAGVSNGCFPLNFAIKSSFKDGGKRETLKSLTSLVKLLNQKRTQKLAWTWKFIVDSMLETCVKDKDINRYNYFTKSSGTYFYDDKPIKVGFVFNDESEGMCTTTKDDITISINPDVVLEKELDIWGIKDVVEHETTHLSVNNHSDYFTVKDIELRRAWRKHNNEAQFKQALKNFIKNNL
jgi:hypothetical protein